jgi:hypothetical protein
MRDFKDGVRVRGGRAVLTVAALLALAAGAVIAGCGGGGVQDGDVAPRRAEAAATAPERRLELGVVALTARIGRDLVESAGVVLDADRGLVLTTAHSVWGATSLKVQSALALLHGRIVARSPCDDIALVETQPRLPGLVALPRDDAVKATAGGRLTALGRDAEGLVRTDLRLVGGGVGRKAAGPIADAAVRLRGTLPATATGAPVLDADGRLVGLAEVAGRSGPALLPARTISERLGELQPGEGTVFAGWRRHYACSGRLDAHARAQHPGYRLLDARLNAPVDVSRLPGAKVAGDG